MTPPPPLGADASLTREMKLGDLVLAAVHADDLVELERLLVKGKEAGTKRMHAMRGLRYLAKRKREKDRQLLKFHDQHPSSGKKKKPRR